MYQFHTLLALTIGPNYCNLDVVRILSNRPVAGVGGEDGRTIV